jgi:RimJ/RimL family protein N-acetyltransferase
MELHPVDIGGGRIVWHTSEQFEAYRRVLARCDLEVCEVMAGNKQEVEDGGTEEDGRG